MIAAEDVATAGEGGLGFLELLLPLATAGIAAAPGVMQLVKSLEGGTSKAERDAKYNAALAQNQAAEAARREAEDAERREAEAKAEQARAEVARAEAARRTELMKTIAMIAVPAVAVLGLTALALRKRSRSNPRRARATRGRTYVRRGDRWVLESRGAR